MIIKDSEQLRKLTGSWYATNDFERIEMEIELEKEHLAELVGDGIIQLAEEYALKESPTPSELELLKHVQLPIAVMATFRHYQSNIVSHDDSTRKVKVDSDNEKLPWEWMLDRDDAAHLLKAQRATDRLINFLDKTNFPQWNDSVQKKATKSLFINNTDVFGNYYPIDHSATFFYTAVPLIKEVQVTKIKAALGSDYEPLLAAFQNNTLNDQQKVLLDLVRSALALASIALSVKRLNAKVIPSGIVKAIKSESQTANAYRPADIAELKYFSNRLEEDSFVFIDRIKRERNKDVPGALEYQLLPKNDPKDKFAST